MDLLENIQADEAAGESMRLINSRFLLLVILVLSIVGCGGGGGGSSPPTTKTVTLKFSAQSTNPNESIAGFLLTVNLPPNSFIPIDSNLSPVPGTVVFAGSSSFFDNFYDTTLRQLNSNYIFSEMLVTDFVNLGQFITIFVTVPVGDTLNVSDITYSFTAKSPLGSNLTTVTVIPTTFN